MTTTAISRYVMHLSYLGTNYSGWQIQDNSNTIQGLIMEALHSILDKDIELIVGAGRTDSGVHAVNYFSHFEYYNLDVLAVTYKLNRFLPDDIVIHKIQSISIDFHARHSALSRKYEYWILADKDPFLINRAYYLNQKLNLELMNKATEILVGKHNFLAFSKSKSKNNICHVTSAYWFKSKNMLIFSIESNRFLYNMVRCIVGTLINLGLGKIDLEDLTNIINSHNRQKSGYSVPACGLYLMSIYYPKEFNLENI